MNTNIEDLEAAARANPDIRSGAGQALDRVRKTLPVQISEMQYVVASEMLAVSDRDLGEAVRRLEPLARVLTFLCDLETDMECELGNGLELGVRALLGEGHRG